MPSALRDAKPPVAIPMERARALSELPQFFGRIAQYRDEFIIHDDGFRGFTFGYQDVASLARSFVARLRANGIKKGDAAMIWSESRPGWIAALWGCLLEGVIVVPVEPQSSPELFRKLVQKVQPRLVLLGDRVPNVPSTSELPVWRLSGIEQAGEPTNLEPVPLYADDVAEIVFTSGTTAEPKGVIITHRNLAAQLRPIEDQIAPYRKYVRPFAPLRILNLLPMSHLFGQSLATFVPPLIPASVVFISSTSPHEIARQIRRRRIAIIVSVPKVLEVLRDFVVHRFPEAANSVDSYGAWPLRWWRFRAIHRMFGWKFCCLVSGGAPLPADIERFWANLGFVVVQGYGLTETAPVISFSHPFHVRHGTAGRPLIGVDLRIAEDGEVLVRGDSVTPGYFEAPQQTSEAFRDGWFHTGDYGERDNEGNLVIRGRKKEIIVTPEGLKVFPEDVEAVLNLLPGVRESAVIGKDRVHAVLVLNPGANADDVVRQANAKLEEHQKIRSVSVWPGAELPRTKTTSKLRRSEIADIVQRGAGQPVSRPSSLLAGLIEKYAPGRTISPDTTMEELGLSSLDRVELMMDLEEKLGATLDERAFASVIKVADLASPLPLAEETAFPSYNRSWIAKLIRGICLEAILLPIAGMIARRRVFGLENLDSLSGPVIFAANHQSHFDTPIILASLPPRWRRWIAPAMWKEYFDAHFHPEKYSRLEHRTNSFLYWLIALLFNGFPIPQTEAGAGESIRYMGELVEEGWSILIFPEGERATTGEIGRFFPGVGMIASRLQLQVVPIRLRGFDRVLPRNAKWPHPGRVEVRFGPPIRLQGDSYSALAQRVEEAVRNS
ncbi:MAG: AMP-binding protein [Bryobacteraceae bacterium]